MHLCKCRLSDWTRKIGKPDLEAAKNWFKQMTSAIGYLHARGIIYRDLQVCIANDFLRIFLYFQPKNILFSFDDRVKLCDLGITTEEILDHGLELEKPFDLQYKVYIAPEQVFFFKLHPFEAARIPIIRVNIMITEGLEIHCESGRVRSRFEPHRVMRSHDG